MLRIALAHDWLCGYRGGEGVLERLIALVRRHHQLAGLYVMFDDRRPVSKLIDATQRTTSRYSDYPFAATRLRRLLLPLYPSATRDLSRRLAAAHAKEPIDLLLSSSSAAVKGVKAPPGVPHVCYCHSPPRYIWSQTDEYTRDSLVRRLGLRFFRKSLQRWDQVSTSADYVTRLIANSAHTAEQILASYERSASVVHPPVRTEYFTPAPERTGEGRDDFWLYVGALEPYKRVDLAIGAANKARNRLIIIGRGSVEDRLRRIAGPTVRFLGRVDDETLRQHYRKARLLVFPQVEDFGIAAVEAQACGLPVVARREGGARDIVIEGVTGTFFDQPRVDHLIPATIRCPLRNDAACRLNAERFAESVFDAAMLRQISELCGV